MIKSIKNNWKNSRSGWFIVLGCMLIQGIPFSIASNIQPLFMGYVVSSKGFTLAGFSLIFTISTIVAAIVSPSIGRMFNKFSPKMLLVIGAILSGAGFFSFGLASSLWEFYIIGAITQIGTAILSSIGVPLLINSWFSEEIKGKAMGLTYAGGALGNMFLQQLTAISLIKNGYTKSYFIFGISSLIVGLLVTLFIVKMPKNPDDIVKEKNKSNSIDNEKSTLPDVNYSINELKNIKYFWIYSLGFILIGLYISAILVQYPTYLKDIVKLPPVMVGSVGSTVAIFSLIGNLLGGILFDKLGITKTICIAGLSAVIGCILLLISESNPNLAFGFAAFLGISIFSYIMGIAYMTGSFFGKKNFASILGTINLMFAIGFAIGSSLFGLIIGKIGYKPTWIIISCIAFIAYFLIAITSLGMKKLNFSTLTSSNYR